MFHIVVETEEEPQHPGRQALQGIPVRASEPYYLDQYQFTPPSMESSPESVPFYTGNPVVESIKGVLHLCKPAVPDPLENDTTAHTSHTSELWDQTIPELRSNLVCVLSVPAWMPPSEFCQWIRKYEGLQQLRFVRPSTPSHYMSVLQFASQHHADHFYMASNAQPYNTIEPERCYAVFVREVNFIEPANGVLFDNQTLKELPSCPVCLEKLDAEESGVVTSLCSHQYHISCLSQCERDTSNCPVCRYSMQRDQEDDHRSVCSECESSENLWICLLCGNIGCSRYKNEHAEMHYQATGHTYALEIDTQRVWDYTGDGYVHRLIQNHVDGKLVEIPDPTNPSMSRAGKEKDHAKMDALAVEFNYLLTTQLESQRLYFEQREAEKDAYIQSLEEKLQRLIDTPPDPGPPPPDKKLTQLQNRLTKLQNELAAQKKESKFLQEINNQLVANQEQWALKINALEISAMEKLQAKEERLSELEGQVQDLMLHLDSAQKCGSQSSNELLDGSVISINSDGASKKQRRRKR